VNFTHDCELTFVVEEVDRMILGAKMRGVVDGIEFYNKKMFFFVQALHIVQYIQPLWIAQLISAYAPLNGGFVAVAS